MKISRIKFYFLALIMLSVTVSCKNDTPKEPLEEAVENQVDSTEKTTEKKALEDLIRVEFPQPGTRITSPLQIKGKARGTWFFEGDFPVRLFDEDNNKIAVTIATAQGEWMTEDWVDFEASMEFEAPASERGVLIFEKSNPSDMRELDNEFRIPVNFN